MEISKTKGFVLVAKAVLNRKTGIKFDYGVCKNKDFLKKTMIGRFI
ncbi:MAG: hypothetical protein GDA46_00710 [Bdellovibrionales bacterium]|nr:hypothetical protein [Bdellovibrionales bacterium]